MHGSGPNFFDFLFFFLPAGAQYNKLNYLAGFLATLAAVIGDRWRLLPTKVLTNCVCGC